MEQVQAAVTQAGIEAANRALGSSFMFETLSSMEEYAFEIPEDMVFVLRITVYVEENNIYGLIKDVDVAQPLKIYVYEDNTQIVGQGEFYFNKLLYFNAKKGSSYTVRFYNSGLKKLVNVMHPRLLARQHIDNLYDGTKGAAHMKKGQMMW